MTGVQTCALPIYKKKDRKVKALEALDKVGLKDHAHKKPNQLSGGQMQRVAIARALVNDPEIILADEPTGALDSRNARVLLETFKEMNEELNSTILMATHDAFSASYASRVLFIKDGEIFNEIIKGKKTRGEFYDEIIDVLTLLGGDIK